MRARGASWRCLAIAICLCCFQISATGQAAAQDAAGAQNSFQLGTATTGGTYHPVGVALSTLIKLKLLPDFDIDLTAINTDGSQQNIELMRQDDIQFAIISALAGYDSRTGTGQFADVGPNEDLRAITTLWLSTDHLLVRDDAVESGTIEDFLQLQGRPVSLGREGSGTLIENRMLFSALDVDVNADFQLQELGYSESAEALANGEIDGMSVSGGVPIGAVQDVFEKLGGEVKALEIADEQLALIDGGRRLWQRVVIPGGTYPGQDRDIFTIGMPNILAVRADVSDEVVYQITKTIFEELKYLHGLHSTTRQISLDNAVNNLPLPIHDGAARYFAEKGVELPSPPMELSPDLLTRYPSVEQARADANQGVVTMFAGTEGDTSTRVAAELASVLNNVESNIRLLSTNGGGIGRNLTDLLYLKGVDTAWVRADALNYADDQAVYPSLRNQVTYISEMFSEEVHLLVNSETDNINDLEGQRINLGAPGSGTDITGSVILSKLGMSAEPTFYEPRTAIEQLKQGDIQGAFFVGGKPMPLLQQIDDDSGLKLLSLPSVDYFGSYRLAEISGFDYPNLMAAGDVVPTIAARTALLTYAWRSESARYEVLDTLTGALFENLLALQEPGNHPKWLEVDPTAEFAPWRRFEPALRWLDDNQGTARRIAGEGRLRLQQQNAERAGAGGGQPLLIENEGDPTFNPEATVELPAPAVETAPLAEESADAAAVPASVEPTIGQAAASEPTVDSNEPPRAGAAFNSSTKRPLTQSRGLTRVPTTGVNSPTF